MGSEVLRIERLSCMDQGNYYLKHINLYIQKGEIVGLFGPNGSGKTALISTLLGGRHLSEGTLYYCGAPIPPVPPYRASQLGIYHISESFSLDPASTIAESLFLGIKSSLLFINRGKEHERANRILEKYGFPFDADTQIYQLDTAQKFALLVIKAVMRGARLLIIDNVLSSFPEKKSSVLHAAILRASNEGTAFLLCDYRLDRLTNLASRIYSVQNGRICAEYDENHLPAYSPLSSLPVDEQPCFPSPSPEKAFEFRFPCNGHFEKICANAGEIVNVCFESEQIVKQIDRSLKRDRLGFGALFLSGRRFSPGLFQSFEAAGLYYLPQSPQIFPNLSFSKNLIVAAHPVHGRNSFIKKSSDRLFFSDLFYTYFFPATKTSEHSDCSGCSLLTQKKISLLRLRAAPPKVIVLNEPAFNLDHRSALEYFKCIHDMASTGISFIILSLDCEKILPLCSKSYFVRKDRLTSFSHKSHTDVQESLSFYHSFWN